MKFNFWPFHSHTWEIFQQSIDRYQTINMQNGIKVGGGYRLTLELRCSDCKKFRWDSADFSCRSSAIAYLNTFVSDPKKKFDIQA
jgi:hypothetical protein